jgi:tetratricopeptide (TPR) repeat protein
MLQDQVRPEEALIEFALAEEADPGWVLNIFHFAHLLIWLGRLDEAFVKLQRLGTLVPDGSGYHAILAEYYLARSDLDKCRKELEKAEQTTEDPLDKPLFRALSHAWAGEREQSLSILRHEATLPDRPTAAQHFALIYAELGELDECFRWIDKAYSTTNLPLQSWQLNPRLKQVRQDPRYHELLKKRNLA